MPTRYDKEFKQNIINLISKANQLPNWPENMALAIQQFINKSRARPKLNPVNRQTKSKRWKSDWLRCLRRTKS